MMNDTTASEETTKNFMQAIEEYIENPPKFASTVTKLLYNQDGIILGLTEDTVTADQPYIEVNRKEFESKYGLTYNWLRVQNGNIINVKPVADNKTKLEPGNDWQADKTFRLISGDESKDTDGWSKKSDS